MDTTMQHTDPITAVVAALPQCTNRKAVRFDLRESFLGRTRSGGIFMSPFSCGTQAIAYESDQMVKMLAEQEGQAIAAEVRGAHDRAAMIRHDVEATRDQYLAVLARFFADPVVCTCDEQQTPTA